MRHPFPFTVRAFAMLFFLVAGLLCSPFAAEAIPNQTANTIPTQPTKDALKRGKDTAMDYVDAYGDLSISVIAIGTDRRNAPLIEAINAELTQQFRKYTGNEIDIVRPEFGIERVERIMARVGNDNDGKPKTFDQKAQDPILREMVQMSSAPYLMVFFVGPDTTGVKDAGLVTIRFIEVATGRELFQISDQFWQDKRQFSNVPTSAWVQHSVTYWMEEIMDKDEINFPAAFSRFRAPIEFVGDVPDNAWLRETIAKATDINKNKINPRRMRADGMDKVSLTLRLDAPPHIMMDEMMAKLTTAFAEEQLVARPLSQDGGSIIFGVSKVPLWHVVSDKDDSPFKQKFVQAYKAEGSPSIAVLSYMSPVVHRTSFGGSAMAIGTATEGILTNLGASVIGIGTADQSFADARAASVDGRYSDALRKMLPANLRDRTQWVLMIEVVPTFRDKYGYKGMATARLIDLEQDRVVSAAIFPSDDSDIPAGEKKLEPHTHAARYLTGTMASAIMSRQNAGGVSKTLDVVIVNAPNFEFVNLVDNIVVARPGVTETVLPAWDGDAGQYSLEARYTGDTKTMVERLRADLSTLPLEVVSFDTGKIVLKYTKPEAAE